MKCHIFYSLYNSIEELALNGFVTPRSTWEEDFDALIPELIEPSTPAYILFRYF